VIFVHRCPSCQKVVENDSPLPPPCPEGCGMMARKFTPLGIRIKGGTPKFHVDAKGYKRDKWKEERQEEEHRDKEADREIAKIDRELEHNYVAGELPHKHGYGSYEDEKVKVAEDRATGVCSHGSEAAL